MKKIILIFLYFISLIINFLITYTLFSLALYDKCYGMLSKSINSRDCYFQGNGLFGMTFLNELLPICIIIGLIFLVVSIFLIINIYKSNNKNKKILILLIVLSLLFNVFTYIIFRYINADFFNDVYIKYYSKLAY